MSVDQHPIAARNLVHVWAWLLVCATFPLIWVGGLVTTTDSGMAFRDWITSDGTFFLFYDWLSSAGDKFIEHGHRLLGAAAGVLAIGLVAIVTWKESRRWVKGLSVVILAAIILQGLLGGARVVFDERSLAMIHGCTGPLFFTLCVVMVVVTSSWWLTVPALAVDRSSNSLPHKTFHLAVVCACLAYVQLVTGAVVRHSPHLIGQWTASLFQLAVYFHLFLALLIVGHILLLAWRSVRCRLQQGLGLCLLLLVAIQVVLGLATWLVKYGLPLWATTWLGEMTFVNREADAFQAAIVTGHVAVGSLVLVVSVAIALRVGRQLRVGLPQWSAAGAILVEVAR